MDHMIWSCNIIRTYHMKGRKKLVTQAKGKSFLQVPTISSYRMLFLHQFWIIYRFHLFCFRDNEIKRMSCCANIFQVQVQWLSDCHLTMESSFVKILSRFAFDDTMPSIFWVILRFLIGWNDCKKIFRNSLSISRSSK